MKSRTKKMTKSELTNDMKSFFGSGFCTVSELAKYLGYKDRSSARKYTRNCQKLGNKIAVSDIAENIIGDMK